MNINELEQRLNAEPELRAAFYADPEAVLANAGVDLADRSAAARITESVTPTIAPRGSTMSSDGRVAVINYMSKV